MLTFHKLFATFFGIGYIGKGGGTVAAVVTCLIWFLIPSEQLSVATQILIVVIICVVGTWSGNIVDAVWGKDSSKVVIDEVAGMLVTLLLVPIEWKYILTALILFRFFDIAKPLYIRKIELLPKGWGVMGDDVLAGLYGRLIMQFIIAFHLF